MINLDKIEDISPEEFIFDKYIGRVGYSIYDVMGDNQDFNDKDYFIIGKCDASRIPVRQRMNEYAIMACSKDDNTMFWFHYSNQNT